MKIFLTLLVSFVLVACQTTDSRNSGFDVDEIQLLAAELDRLDVGIGPATRNIPIFPLDSWQYVSDEYLVISDGRDGAFLLTFLEPCPETRQAINLGVRTSGTLLNPNDYILPVSVSGSMGGCRIEEINTLLPRSEERSNAL